MAWKGWVSIEPLKDGSFVKVSNEAPMITEWAVIEVEDAAAV